ncbi:MAG: serine hydrolase domain-containing protein [Candidatus Binatia bacterium]
MEPGIGGHVAPGFEKVRKAFEANFAGGLETGASFAVERDGEPLVDLWGGFADAAGQRAWQADTLVNVWSTTKGLASLCVAMLVDRGLLSYEQSMADLWPEFAAAGKQDLTVGEVLSHQGGLSGAAAKISVREFADHDAMASLLAGQVPLFDKGQSGYHAVTHGFLTGEIVRRVDGRTLGRFFAEEVAGPLGADAWIGLPPGEDGRVATMIPAPKGTPMALPPHPAARAALANPPLDAEAANADWWRRAEIPSVNAQANAGALARIYGMLASGGERDGRRYLSPATIAEATRKRVHGKDLVLGIPMRWAAGFSINDGITYGKNRNTYGHSGWGGSFGCADPDARLGIGYAMNRMYANLRGDPRSLSLLAALYESLGESSSTA